MRRALALLALGVAAHGSTPAAAAPPQRLSLATAAQAAQPDVALDPGRGFIVTWQESLGDEASLHFATLDLSGRETSRGLVARGTGWFVNWADFPSLVVLDNGDWVAYWLQRNDPAAPEGYDIRIVRSRDRGRTWSPPVSPHRDGTATQHGFVTLLPDGADRVLAIWLDGRLAATAAAAATTMAGHGSHDEESAPMTLRTAVLDRAGVHRAEASLDERTCSCCQTDAVRRNGRVFVVYRDRSADEIRDIAFVLRGRDRHWTTPRTLHADNWRIEGCPVNGPAVATNGARLLAIWPTLAGEAIELRYTTGDWNDPGAARTLQTPSPPSGRVDAAPWGDGFIVTWVSRARDRPGVEYARIDPNGSVAGGELIAQPAVRGRATGFPRVASDGSTALFVWTESDGGQGGQAIGAALLRRD